jgi:hypothetical protein
MYCSFRQFRFIPEFSFEGREIKMTFMLCNLNQYNNTIYIIPGTLNDKTSMEYVVFINVS